MFLLQQSMLGYDCKHEDTLQKDNITWEKVEWKDEFKEKEGKGQNG